MCFAVAAKAVNVCRSALVGGFFLVPGSTSPLFSGYDGDSRGGGGGHSGGGFTALDMLFFGFSVGSVV